jgi:hypothetical protein
MKLNFKVIQPLLLIGLFSLQSCSPIFNGIYGFKKLKTLTEDEIIKTAVKFNIPLENCLVLDTNYKSLLKSFDTLTQAEAVKNHYQPLQMLYFNKDKNRIYLRSVLSSSSFYGEYKFKQTEEKKFEIDKFYLRRSLPATIEFVRIR